MMFVSCQGNGFKFIVSDHLTQFIAGQTDEHWTLIQWASSQHPTELNLTLKRTDCLNPDTMEIV